MGLYLLTDSENRKRFLSAGPYAALAVCILTISPHLVWLIQNNFSSFHYALARAGHQTGLIARIVLPFKFLASQIIDLTPALVLALIVGLFNWPANDVREPQEKNDWQFLVVIGLGPAVLTALISLLLGFGLRAMWGAPMWNLTGLTLVFMAGSRGDNASFGRLGAGVLVLFIAMPLFFWITTSYGPERRGHPERSAWPDRAMARNFDQTWLTLTGQPLDIVAGDGWLAGLIAMRSNPRPSVLTDGNMKLAPWITDERLQKKGALVVWRITDKTGKPPAQLAALPHFKDMGIMQFSWPRARTAPMLTVGWGVVPPQR